MEKYLIVWNEFKNEGVIFKEDAVDDAYHAGGGMTCNPCSSIADNFREAYGEEDKCYLQRIVIDNSECQLIEKDF
ncbi:MAG: hypothetical protein WBR21_08440 [Rouxiella badensis]|uniref:hypothetical protein n=1 Tax=Rouxiella badensis TaxID=1646377 RepID=UPI003C66C2F7